MGARRWRDVQPRRLGLGGHHAVPSVPRGHRPLGGLASDCASLGDLRRCKRERAIKHSALDYLLKPVDKDELIHTIQRAREHKTLKASQRVDSLLEMLNLKKNNKRFAVPTLEGLIMVDSETILYCESDSAYCKIYFINSNKPLVISKTLKDVEEVMQGTDFCRIHNSYFINMKCVLSYIRGEGGEVVLNNGIHLPVSRTRKQDFLNLLEKI